MGTDGRQTRRVMAGALIIAALVGTGVLIFFLDSIIKAFDSRYEVVAVLPAAPDIIDGTPVWIGGREVGTVTKIEFLAASPDTLANVALTLDLPSKLAAQVRGDSHVRIASARLIGSRVIDIEPGTLTTVPLAEGDTLRPETAAVTAASLMAHAASVQAGLDVVLVDVRRISPLLSVRMVEARSAMTGMQAAMGTAGQIAEDMRTGPGIATLNSAEFRASLQRAQSHMAAMPQLFAKMQERSADAAEVGAALARLQARADSVSAQLASVSLRVQNGTLMRMQQDTALARAMNRARAQLDSLIMEAKAKPLRFVF